MQADTRAAVYRLGTSAVRSQQFYNLAGRITCPLFVIAGGLDRLCPPQDARQLAGEARGPVELLVVEDGNHVAHNRFYKYRGRSADWMARQLNAQVSR